MVESISECNKWGLYSWCPKQALARNKPGATHHFEYLIWENCKPLVFQTRQEAREYANKRYGDSKTRKDLREFPHFWRVPRPVKITGIRYEVAHD